MSDDLTFSYRLLFVLSFLSLIFKIRCTNTSSCDEVFFILMRAAHNTCTARDLNVIIVL